MRASFPHSGHTHRPPKERQLHSRVMRLADFNVWTLLITIRQRRQKLFEHAVELIGLVNKKGV